MSDEERAAWDRGVAVYRAKYSQRDLLDDEMAAIKNVLRNAYGADSLTGIELDAELRTALESAAPVYRRLWWPAHDAANRAWIDAVLPALRRYGPELAPRVAAAYGERWPASPIPVDLSVSAGPNGAYATSPPAHVTIASTDRGHQGRASLETLFHESSHQWGRRLSQIIAASAQTRGKTVPRGLWHAVLFYNTGELTRRALAETGQPDYVESAVAGGMYKDFCGEGCRERIAPHWNAHLDGKETMAQALDGIVADWPGAN